MNIPEGWPTKEMKLAAEAYFYSACVVSTGRAQSNEYRLPPMFKWDDLLEIMLAAAPTPPQEQAELPKLVVYKSTSIPKEQWRNEPIDYWLKKMLEHCDYHDGLVIKATLAFLEGLKPAQEDDINEYASNAVVAQNHEKVDDKAQDVLDELASKQEPLGKEFENVLYNNLDQLYESSKPAQEDKPVVWIDPDNLDCVLRQGRGGALRYVMPEPERSTDIPLYAHPADDKLRKAAEEACGMLEGYMYSEWLCAQENEVVKNLRAALEGE